MVAFRKLSQLQNNFTFFPRLYNSFLLESGQKRKIFQVRGEDQALYSEQVFYFYDISKSLWYFKTTLPTYIEENIPLYYPQSLV